MNSTPEKPQPIRAEDGSLKYPGSLNVSEELSGRQKNDIASKLKEKPTRPTRWQLKLTVYRGITRIT
jgi:hypothetical protein